MKILDRDDYLTPQTPLTPLHRPSATMSAAQQVVDFTGCAPGQAAAALAAVGGDVQTAVEMLLEGAVFPEAAGGGGGGAGGAPPVWEFEDGPPGCGRYRALAPETQLALEAAHAAGQAQASFAFRQFTYDVDLVAMTQTNTQTGMMRPLRRGGVGGGGAGGVAAAGGAGGAPPWAQLQQQQQQPVKGAGKKGKKGKKRRERSAGSPELLGVLNYDHTYAASTRPGPCRGRL